ncbi:MAG: RHS repeat-associated core domain-containing protein [Anaerolinea sp.]|nr:RHS repeat-associated core domain-containing protein [Anaerolinea sp.]
MDALGSLRGVVNPTGEVLEGQDYAPYGTPFGQTGTPQTPFGFTGEQTDPNDLLYLRARYYVPELGVFPSLDPVEEGNRYGYVGGNVVNRVDPSGMFDWDNFVVEARDSLDCIAREGGATTSWQIEAFVQETVKLNDPLHMLLGGNIGSESALDSRGRLIPGKRLVVPNRVADPSGLGMDLSNIHTTGRSRRIRRCLGPEAATMVPSRSPVTRSGIGYIEGVNTSVVGVFVGGTIGVEVVYNFATFQRMTFDYSGIGLALNLGASVVPYGGYVWGLRENRFSPNEFSTFTEDYGGKFEYFSFSGSVPLPMLFSRGKVGFGIGVSGTGFKNQEQTVQGILFGVTAGVSLLPIDLGLGKTGSFERDEISYIQGCRVDIERLKADIRGGNLFFRMSFGELRETVSSAAEVLALQYNQRCVCGLSEVGKGTP